MLMGSQELHEKIARLAKSKSKRTRLLASELTRVQEATAAMQNICSSLFRDGKPIPEEVAEVLGHMMEGMEVTIKSINGFNDANS